MKRQKNRKSCCYSPLAPGPGVHFTMSTSVFGFFGRPNGSRHGSPLPSFSSGSPSSSSFPLSSNFPSLHPTYRYPAFTYRRLAATLSTSTCSATHAGADHPGQVEEVTVRREVEKSGHVRHERLPRTLGSTRGEEREVARSDERRAVLAVISHEAQKVTAAPPHLRGNRTTEVSQGRVRVGRGG